MTHLFHPVLPSRSCLRMHATVGPLGCVTEWLGVWGKCWRPAAQKLKGLAVWSCKIPLYSAKFSGAGIGHDQQHWTHLHGTTLEFVAKLNVSSDLRAFECLVTRVSSNTPRRHLKNPTTWLKGMLASVRGDTEEFIVHVNQDAIITPRAAEREEQDKSVAETLHLNWSGDFGWVCQTSSNVVQTLSCIDIAEHRI